jgi:RND family efflux transporter MFP subunit
MSVKTKILRILVPVSVIIIGIIIMAALVSRRPAPKREVKEAPGILVQLIRADKTSREIAVKGTGTVKAAREVSVVPQVDGKITYISSKLVAGGFFLKGEILFEIEDSDYRLKLENALAARAKAEYELATVQSQALIARREWERINKGSEVPPNPLVLYEPQLKNAGAGLASADAAVRQAELDLERTKVKAAFNSRVRSEDIDIGQYVRAGTGVAVLSGTDVAEIIVPMSLSDMRWLNIPRQGDKKKGSPVSVQVSIAGRSHEWYGYVVRSTGEVDPKSRMMQLVVEVKNPYELKENNALERPELAVGTFVDVRIRGSVIENVFIVPRTAFRDNSTVWIMDADKKLQIRKVVPLRIEKEEIIVTEGLRDGDMIVLTNISGAAVGMKLRPMK